MNVNDELRAGRVPPLTLKDGTVLGDDPPPFIADLAAVLRRADGGRASGTRYLVMAQAAIDSLSDHTS